MLSAMDDAIGRVMEKVRALGLEENTLIFFFSDNGGPTMQGTTINGSRNFPLRGSKRTTLEGGIRVPFIMAWKGQLPAGKVYDQPIIQLDILPTCLAAAGVSQNGLNPDPKTPLDGVNLLPYVKGEKTSAPHDVLYWRFGEQMAIRAGDWVLVRYDSAVDTGLKSQVKAKGGVTPARLYNLAKDIGQTNDLANQEPERVRHLQDMWNRWNSELAPPLWGGQKGKGAGEE
jgi:arylsulfatase A-like enzyme